MEKPKTIRRRRSDCSWKKEPKAKSSIESDTVHYPEGPIEITCSWNPIDRTEKPPYSYATIIGHAILTSKERKLTLHDIYVWITENYPFYSNDTQGWQNSIRHNLSLHKSFVKIDRDGHVQNPPRKGCFWTIREGSERFFVDNLQKPVSSVRRQQSLTHLTAGMKRQHLLRRTSSNILPPSSSTTSTSNTTPSSPSRLLNHFRTTTTTRDVPEAEHHLLPSSLSSDLLSSPSSSSLSGSSPTTYHQLFYNVPDSTMSYNVYPTEQADLFNNDYYLNSSGSATGSHPPSLSPCDAYSTTSSYNNDYQSISRGSNRSSFSGTATLSLGYPVAYDPASYKTKSSAFPLNHQYQQYSYQQPSEQGQPDTLMEEWNKWYHIPHDTAENTLAHLSSDSNYVQPPSRSNSMGLHSYHR
ncbi:forkhead box protein I3 [Mucor ambiguus]|uniref:Forkhead box protein I3 n=1 Tax=Mucor ambiguus TaxID=91626 RepID=A0A0C9MLB5_9FUNG|nr:forkhead box protein I3 [Mucor ambiguus]